MGQDTPEVDPELVEIENALDQLKRVSTNSVDPKRLKRAAKHLENVLERAQEDNATVDEYLSDSRQPRSKDA